jgi:hypothetical protein
MCHDISTKFHGNCFSHCKVDSGRFTGTEHGDLINLLLYSHNNESRPTREDTFHEQ